MSYKFEYNHIKLPKDKDRRVKLTDQDRIDIVGKYAVGNTSQRKLALEYGVDRRLIQFVLDPKKLEENKKRRAERGGSKIYYDKDKHREAIKEHRHYKQKVLNGE